MVDTTFIAQATRIPAAWLNDVNRSTYRGFINIQNAPFSAACNGTTDDTAAVAAAVAALPSGGTLFYAGTPLISNKITINKKIHLVGLGGIGTTTSDFPTAYFLKKSTMTTACLEITKEGVILDGGGVVGQVGNSGDNIVILANSVTCRDVTSVRAGQDGFRVGQDAAGVNSNSWVLDNCHAYNNVRRGLYVHSGDTNANVGSAKDFQALSNGEDGIRFDKCILNSIIGGLSEANIGYGIRFASNSVYNSIIGGDRETNTAGQIVLDSGSSHSFISIGNPAEVVDNSDLTASNTTCRADRSFGKQGQWTPALAGSSTPGTQTYSLRQGWWERAGDHLHIHFAITLSALDGTTAGSIRVTGLPLAFPTGFTNGYVGGSISQWGGIIFPANFTQLALRLGSNTQHIQLERCGSGQAAADVLAAELSATSQIIGSLVYPIAQI